MRRDVLEEFVEAAQLGRKRHHVEHGLRVYREPRDPLTTFRAEVHAFVLMIKTRPRRRTGRPNPWKLSTPWGITNKPIVILDGESS